MPKRRRRPLLRALLVIALVLVVVVLGTVAAATLLFDPNALRPRIEAAADGATGGKLTLHGPVHLAIGLRPRLVAEDVGYVGPRNAMAVHLARLTARVALLPLFAGRLDIVRLNLLQPALTLAAPGAVPPPAAPPPAPKPAAQAGGGGGRLPLSVEAVHVLGGAVRWGDVMVTVPRLDAVSAAPGATLVISGQVVSGGHAFALSGETGPVEALLAPAGAAPWPVQVVLHAPAARLGLRGSLTPPPGRLGYSLQIDAAATDLASIAKLLPWKLPPLQDASGSARVVGLAGAAPQVSALALHLGGLDLGAWMPGLALARADLTAPDPLHAAQIDAQAILHGLPVNLRGTIGPFAPALPVALAVDAKPALEGQANGTVTIADHPALRGTVALQKLDLDALLAALPRRRPAAPPAAQAPPPGGAPPRPHVIPDQPFDLAPLRRADADLQISIATLATGGATYSDVTGHLVLTGGRLALDPVAGQSPGGTLDGKLLIDAAAPSPPMALVLRAPALSFAPLAAAFGHAGALVGTASIDADLKGAGLSPHALAATLAGTLVLDARDAEIDNALLVNALGVLTKAAKLPEGALGGEARTKLRCVEVKLRAANGIVTAGTLVLDTPKFAVQGSGTIDLATEMLNLRLRPLLRVGPGIVVPMRLTGPFEQPKEAVDVAAAARATLGGAGPAETCGPGGGEPPAGAAEAPKIPKTLEILRGLLAH